MSKISLNHRMPRITTFDSHVLLLGVVFVQTKIICERIDKVRHYQVRNSYEGQRVNDCCYRFKWDQVSNVVFKRYPNPWSIHVLSEDVIAREVVGPVLKTIRIISKTNKVPKIAEKFLTTTCGYVVEESHINATEKTVVTYTRNLTNAHLMCVDEKCEYSISPESKNWTLLKRQAWFTSNLYGLSRVVESLGVERYKKNIKKSVKGLEYILTRMYVPEKIPNMNMTAVPLVQSI